MPADPITSETLTAMLAAATPGPWRSLWNDPEAASENYMGGIIVSGAEGEFVVLETWWDGPRTACTEPNAALIARAPALAAEVLDLRARVAELEGRTVPELPEGWSEDNPTHFEGPDARVAIVGDGVCVMSRGRVDVIPRAVLLRALGVPDAP